MQFGISTRTGSVRYRPGVHSTLPGEAVWGPIPLVHFKVNNHARAVVITCPQTARIVLIPNETDQFRPNFKYYCLPITAVPQAWVLCLYFARTAELLSPGRKIEGV